VEVAADLEVPDGDDDEQPVLGALGPTAQRLTKVTPPPAMAACFADSMRPISAAMVPVMVRTDSRTPWGITAALPVSISTAIVSPIALPSPNMTEAICPNSPLGR